MAYDGVVEPHPIGVIEHRRSAERIDQPFGPVEVEGVDFQLGAEGVGPAGRAGDRAHAVPGVQEPPRDVLAAVAQGSGYHVQLLLAHWMPASEVG